MSSIDKSTDIRQSSPWASYMEKIGWNVIKINNVTVFTKKIKILNKSIVKVQHSKGKIDLKKIEKEIKKTNPLFIIVEPHSFGFNEQDYLNSGFKKSKWRVAPSATIKLDLSKTEKEIFNTFSENAKRNIKKAERNNLEIKIVDLKKDKNLKSFDEYFNLLNSLRKQKGFYAPSHDESYKKMESFKNNSILLFAYDNSTPIAVVWLGFFDKVVTYLQTGITKRGYELLANYQLVWEGIKWSKKQKNLVFDFESIYDLRNPRENKNWIGFSEFKKRFHGEVIYYPSSYIKINSKVFKSFYFLSTFLQRSSREIVYSKINSTIEFKKSYGKDAILVNNIPQSGGELLGMWEKIFKSIEKQEKLFKKGLVLGVGGGDVVRLIQSSFPKVSITAVELDPVMIDIAKNNFGTTSKNTRFIIEDAQNFINENVRKYDLIICDLYIGRFNPKFSREKIFLKKIAKSLNKDGLILFNAHYDRKFQKDFDEFYKLGLDIFDEVSVAYKFPRNQVLLFRGPHF